MTKMTGDGKLGDPAGYAHTVYDGEPWFGGKSIPTVSEF